jgi:hypothetical protein
MADQQFLLQDFQAVIDVVIDRNAGFGLELVQGGRTDIVVPVIDIDGLRPGGPRHGKDCRRDGADQAVCDIPNHPCSPSMLERTVPPWRDG